MAGLAFNSVICTTPQFYHKNLEIRSSLNGPLVVSGGVSGTSVLASSNSGSVSGRREGEERRVDSKWMTRALARTAVEEGMADAKRAIDEVLMSKGGEAWRRCRGLVCGQGDEAIAG